MTSGDFHHIDFVMEVHFDLHHVVGWDNTKKLLLSFCFQDRYVVEESKK